MQFEDHLETIPSIDAVKIVSKEMEIHDTLEIVRSSNDTAPYERIFEVMREYGYKPTGQPGDAKPVNIRVYSVDAARRVVNWYD